jgi:signal transduction histidine kinase/CheY-like chemotaxis protein
VSHDWFHAVACGLTAPVLLVAGDTTVVAGNPVGLSCLKGAAPNPRLVDEVADPERLERYVRLGFRSSSPLPGALTFKRSEQRFRCSAAAIRKEGQVLLLLELRGADEAAARFLALDRQIARLNAEIHRRVEVEREREAVIESERAARQEAENAGRLKDQFLASVCHELRTPLHAISGWTDLMMMNPNDEGMRRRGLEVIVRNAKAQAQLTEDLVDVSLVMTGRMRLDLSPVDLDVLVRDAVDTCRPDAERKRHTIDVLTGGSGFVLHGDPRRLQQVVANLLTNAIKYTPDGGKIQVLLKRVNSHIELSVSDTGEGIAPEMLPHVFDTFRRGDGSSTRRQGGLGLGLSIVRHLIELHGGVVMVDSPGAGQGTVFTVSLPTPLFRPAEAAVPADGCALVEARETLKGRVILLVEDHDDSRDLLKSILEGQGALVRDVAGSVAGQASFSTEPPNFVISDIEMPGEDGFTFMRKLRALERELGRKPVPAIAVSAHGVGEARTRALQAGFQAFLGKPVQPAELVASVASLAATAQL